MTNPPQKASNPNFEIDDPEDGRYQPREEDETCGQNLQSGIIIGGEITKRGELPFVVSLGYTNGRVWRNSCGGTLINKRYVLTAAHCQDTSKRTKTIARVTIGDWNLAKDPDSYGLAKAQMFDITPQDVIVHEGWDVNKVDSNGNDIALIRLPRLAVTYDDDDELIAMPACLKWVDSIQLPEYKTWVAGWGRTSNDRWDKGDVLEGGAHSNFLQKAEAPIIPQATCHQKYPDFRRTTDKQICAGAVPGEFIIQVFNKNG